jgi:hypothetical protein
MISVPEIGYVRRSELIEQLAGRLNDYVGAPGYLTRIQIVQNILKTLMSLADINCKNGEYDP